MRHLAKGILVALFVLVAAGPVRAAEKSYELDNAHSFVGFSVKHMGVSSVRGEFTKFEADLVVDENEIENSSVILRIDAASVDTDHEDRDKDLRGVDFLEVETYPEIVFESRKIEVVGDGRYRATGDLTIRDTTREVVLDLEIDGPIRDPWGNYRVGAEGRVTIDRKQWGVQYSRIMDNGGLVVADDVRIEFALEGRRRAE